MSDSHGAGDLPAASIPPATTRRRRRVFACLSVALALTLGLAALEIACRLFLPNHTPGYLASKFALEYVASPFCRHMFPAREQRIYDVTQPDRLVFRINRYGYRGPDFTPDKPQGVFRIVVIGGSAAFDPGATEGNDWPHQIQGLLRARGYSNVEVINAGIPGHAAPDSLGRMNAEIHELAPDVVLFYHAWNDLKYLRHLASGWTMLRAIVPFDPHYSDPLQSATGWLDAFLCHSRLYGDLRYAFLTRWLKVGEEGSTVERLPESPFFASTKLGPSSWERYTERFDRQYQLNFRDLVDCARNMGAAPVVAVPAVLIHAGNTPAEQKKLKLDYVKLPLDKVVQLIDDLNRILRQTAQEKQCLLLDLSAFSGRNELFASGVHFSEQGSAAIATAAADFLETNFKEAIAQAAAKKNP